MAFYWLKKGAELQSAYCLNGLGRYYQNGLVVEVNYEKAFHYYELAAEMGSPAALHNIGYCYQNGFGVEQSYERAVEWYQKAIELGYTNIPKIYGFDPLIMEKIKGQNIFEYAFLTKGFKKALLGRIVSALTELHNITPSIPANVQDCENNYITKTFDRLAKVQDLVPFSDSETVIINGKKCINIFAIKDKIIETMRSMYPKDFHFIHGDCTFHNMMIETEGVRPILIDPRGYFGSTKFYGDVDYDWAKLYYSIVGDYDQFNRKNFSLNIKESEVELEIISNNWKNLENDFFEMTGANRKKIKLLHALIWLSLTTYAWEDYDSICGAFYKGLLELQEFSDEK